MAGKSTGEKIGLSVYLPADVARRLKLTADHQNRSASEVVAELLDRHLPRLQADEKKKGNIPYA